MDDILTPEQWTDLQGKLKLQYPELTDSDLQYQEAAESDMLQMIYYILCKPRRKIRRLGERYRSINSNRQYWQDCGLVRQKFHEI